MPETPRRQTLDEINALAAAPCFARTIDALDRNWLAKDHTDHKRFVGALTRSVRTAIEQRSIESAFVQLLPEVLTFCHSAFGFIAEVKYSFNGCPYLQSHAVTDIYKPSYTIHDVISDLQFHNLQTLNGAIMTSCKPVLSNDPSNDPRSGGVPFGHQSLQAYLGLPFVVEDELVGALALGNCPKGYSESDIIRLAFMCTISGLLISDYRQL